MSDGGIDILMITYNRPAYTRLSLPRLLETCGETCRVWLWHNGRDRETLEVVESMRDHLRFHRLHHSPKNKKIDEPTNWFWQNASGDYLGKVDDDCLMPNGWCERLLDAHRTPEAGILGSWPFVQEDIRDELVAKKTINLGPTRIMGNPWVGGAGYIMKRVCLERCGLLRPGEGFTSYCTRVAKAGWINGWPLPMIVMDHMDDPRSAHTVFKTDEDVLQHRGLTAERRGIRTVEELTARVKQAALELQTCSPDWRDYVGWRVRWRRMKQRFDRCPASQ